jgi:hypothetical protein
MENEKEKKPIDWFSRMNTEEGKLISWMYFIKYNQAKNIECEFKQRYNYEGNINFTNLPKDFNWNKRTVSKENIPRYSHIANLQSYWSKEGFLTKVSTKELSEEQMEKIPELSIKTDHYAYLFNMNPVFRVLKEKFNITLNKKEKLFFEKAFSDFRFRRLLFDLYVIKNKNLKSFYIIENIKPVKISVISAILKTTREFILSDDYEYVFQNDKEKLKMFKEIHHNLSNSSALETSHSINKKLHKVLQDLLLQI